MEGEGMINQEQLNAIKERVAKAAPGPWDINRNSDDDVFVTDIWFDGEDGGHVEIHGDPVASSIYNAEFIAHAREDVPALVTEVERLNQALEQVMKVEEPIMEGWETPAYKIASKALGGEAHE